MPSTVEVFGVQFPGRENRIRETPLDELAVLIDSLTDDLEPCLADGPPFVLCGHSLGALVSFEVARELRRRHARAPKALIVSGRTPPQVPLQRRQRHALSDGELISDIQQLDGIPAEIMANREMLDLVLPTLRADLALDERYVYTGEPPLDCPILALGGCDDPEVAPADLVKWEIHTRSGFSVKTFPGGHFFFHTSASQFTVELSAYLTALATAS